jgi:hypothetical protein
MLFQLIHQYHGIAVPVGNNVLSKMVQGICLGAGLGGRKADHSLCVSSASCLYEAGVPEKLIKQRTGHGSYNALCMYERVTETQGMAILSGEKCKRKFLNPIILLNPITF